MIMLLLLACGGDKLDLDVQPARLTFAEPINFVGELPEGGYAEGEVTVLNEGEGAVALTLEAYDTDHLCLKGFPDGSADASLGELSPGSSYVLTIGICGYLAGEATTLVETGVRLLTDGEPAFVDIPVEFTPIRDNDGDGFGTGLAGDPTSDCDDTNPEVYPGASDEPGDGIDQDCDGES